MLTAGIGSSTGTTTGRTTAGGAAGVASRACSGGFLRRDPSARIFCTRSRWKVSDVVTSRVVSGFGM
jgi:hypothetical protein